MGMGGMGNPAMRGQGGYQGGMGGGIGSVLQGLQGYNPMQRNGMGGPMSMPGQDPSGGYQGSGYGGAGMSSIGPGGMGSSPQSGFSPGRPFMDTLSSTADPAGGGVGYNGSAATPNQSGGMNPAMFSGGMQQIGNRPPPIMPTMMNQATGRMEYTGGGGGQAGLGDYANPASEMGVQQGYTGTQQGMNFINGHLYAGEGLSQATDPNQQSFAFNNFLRQYMPQFAQQGPGMPSQNPMARPAQPQIQGQQQNPFLRGTQPQIQGQQGFNPNWLK